MGRGKRLQPSSPSALKWPVGGLGGRWARREVEDRELSCALRIRAGTSVGVRPERSASPPAAGAGKGQAAWSQEGRTGRASALGRRVWPSLPPRGRTPRPRPWGKGSGSSRERKVYPQARPDPAPGGESAGAAGLAGSYLRAGRQLELVLLPGAVAVGLHQRLWGSCSRSRFQARRRRGFGRLGLLRPRGPRPITAARAAAWPAPPPSHAAARAAPSHLSHHSCCRLHHRRRRSPHRTTANMAAPGCPSIAASRSEGMRSLRRRTSPPRLPAPF